MFHFYYIITTDMISV